MCSRILLITGNIYGGKIDRWLICDSQFEMSCIMSVVKAQELKVRYKSCTKSWVVAYGKSKKTVEISSILL